MSGPTRALLALVLGAWLMACGDPAQGPAKVAWGRTATVLTPENLLVARRMCEAFDEQAAECAVPTTAAPLTIAGDGPTLMAALEKLANSR